MISSGNWGSWWFFSGVKRRDGDGIKFFGGEIVFGEVSDGTAVNITGSALSADSAEFGQVGWVGMFKFFVKSQLAS